MTRNKRYVFYIYIVFFFLNYSNIQQQCYAKYVEICNVLGQLKVYIVYNVLCLACKLYNHNLLVWRSKICSGESNIPVCHLAQKYIKNVNINGGWPGWLQQYGGRSERVVLELVFTCEYYKQQDW
jgi:hypothetical protein